MASQSTAPLPPRLKKLRQRFEKWRAERKSATERIPDPLWDAAAKAATKFGVYRTARAVRLDYMKLRNRVSPAETSADAPATPQQASFVEVSVTPGSKLPPCTVELEAPSGVKLRMEFSDIDVAVLESVVRSLLDAPR